MAQIEHPVPTHKKLDKATLTKAYELMCTAKSMSELYEANKKITAKYVHATSRGHEAIQLALGLQLKPQDFVAPYYRDDSILLGIGMQPYELMLQLLAKKDDPFSGGRTYYSHPSLRRDDMPKIPHQSSATGMQAIPITGVAMGMQHREIVGLDKITDPQDRPLAVCSIGDAAMTEGEIAEALHMASLKSLPIIYLVQDNEWDISAHAREIRKGDASDFAKGFPGLEVVQLDGTDFIACYERLAEVMDDIRTNPKPYLVHATVPLLGHHTSGVRMEFYRDDLDEAALRDPFPKFRKQMRSAGFEANELDQIEKEAKELVQADYNRALKAEDPTPEDLRTHYFAPTPVTEEKGTREPVGGEERLMVDCALFGIREIMEDDSTSLLYGQDVGARLGGVFREAATLAQQFGDDRVFNTPIQEAFIIGSTVGMAAVGLKPIVEVQFADYIWPGLNQLFTELSRSYYLSNGKWPASAVLRVPIGAYGSGGPYHSSSVESVLTNIRGIKVVYPSNGADMKGLMKSAYLDPNPVVMLEHKGLYWSKIPGTEEAKSVEPSADYIVPLGKARTALAATSENEKIAIITYGRGVYWAKEAAQQFEGQVEILDLRTLVPLDEEAIFAAVKKCSRVLVLTEEPYTNSFAPSIAGRIADSCFEHLDAPVGVLGSEDVPAPPLNSVLETAMLPSAEKVARKLKSLLAY